MKTETKNNIKQYVFDSAPVTVKNMVDKFGLSPQIIHRHIKSLIEMGEISKRGTPPKVYYFPNKGDLNIQNKCNFNQAQSELLEKNFVLFNADGSKYNGVVAFQQRCKIRGLDPKKEIIFYQSIFKKYNQYKNKRQLIDGIQKIENSFDHTYIDELWYIDFYSIEKYGKTLLGNLVLYAKQSGDLELIEHISTKIKPIINQLIKDKNIDSYAIVPHSVSRKIQFLPQLAKKLDIQLPSLEIIKIFADKIVPQKSLSKIQERVTNAKDTIFLTENQNKSDTVLLIDDAVGSGASLNETAKKIKDKGLAKKVIGLSIVGSFKGFEVIKEA